jgi:hypothetical protein
MPALCGVCQWDCKRAATHAGPCPGGLPIQLLAFESWHGWAQAERHFGGEEIDTASVEMWWLMCTTGKRACTNERDATKSESQ